MRERHRRKGGKKDLGETGISNRLIFADRAPRGEMVRGEPARGKVEEGRGEGWNEGEGDGMCDGDEGHKRSDSEGKSGEVGQRGETLAGKFVKQGEEVQVG